MEANELYKPLVHDDGNAGASSLCVPSSSLTGATTTTVLATASLPMANLQNHAVTIIPVPVGPNPMRMRCHHCLADIMTDTTTVHKDTAHLCCLLTASATCCLCFWIPYCCCNVFQKVDHKCPNCRSYLGTYNG